MTTTDNVFAGSIPAAYDELMVPMLFAPYAGDMAERAAKAGARDILETACGTGVVARAIGARLPGASITATDLNPAMLEVAAARTDNDAIRYEAADAQSLRFDDQSFDLVACQFGVMFYPDRVAANREAFRVLRPGGTYLLAIWDRIDRNPASLAIHEAMAGLFPEDPPGFIARVPFGYSDLDRIADDLLAAGFDDLEFETIVHESRSGSARDAARAMCHGSPLRSEIEARDPDRLDEMTSAVEAALARFGGPRGFSAPMSAHLVSAAR